MIEFTVTVMLGEVSKFPLCLIIIYVIKKLCSLVVFCFCFTFH